MSVCAFPKREGRGSDAPSRIGSAAPVPADDGGGVAVPAGVELAMAWLGVVALVFSLAGRQVPESVWNPGPSTGIVAYISRAIAAIGCGTVVIPAGSYNFSTPIYKPRCIRLAAEPPGSVVLLYTGAGAALVVGDMAGPSLYRAGGLSGITLEGPGPTSQTIGVYLGGDPGGVVDSPEDYADFQSFEDVDVRGFGVGFTFGNNAWLISWTRCEIDRNGTGLLWPSGLTNAGENLSIYQSAVFNNAGPGMELHGGEWYAVGLSADFNGAGDGPALVGNSFRLTCFGCHLEQDVGSLVSTSGPGESDVALYGGWLALDSPYSTDRAMVAIAGDNSGLLVISTAFTSGHPVDEAVCFTAQGDRRSLTILSVALGADGPLGRLINPMPPWPLEWIAPGALVAAPAAAGSLGWARGGGGMVGPMASPARPGRGRGPGCVGSRPKCVGSAR